jgi:hypothetical protein
LSLPGEVSLQAVQSELAAAAGYAAAAGIELDTLGLTTDHMFFYATFQNLAGERFVAEFDCRDYPLHPPTIEFLSEDRAQRGLPRMYPAGFHNMPCVCMRYNRKAYQERGGPHTDWRLLDWQLPTSNGVPIDSLALVLSDLDSKIRQSAGRMG